MSQGLIWHYTDLVGLMGIVREHEIWASSCSFMNDPKEDRYAAEVMTQAIDEAGPKWSHLNDYLHHGPLQHENREAFSRRFVLCASAARDNLELWRAYGSQSVSGTFAVGLDPHVPLGLKIDKSMETQHAVQTAGWVAVQYEPQRAAATRVCEELRRQLAALPADSGVEEAGVWINDGTRMLAEWQVVDSALGDLISTGKHAAYQAEQERRLSFTLPMDLPYQLRKGPLGPVPYVVMTAADSWGQCVSQSKPLPIREVMVWPGAPPQAWKGVAALLGSAGYAHDRDGWNEPLADGSVRVSVSEIPFV